MKKYFIPLALFIIMLGGLFWSRAVLSFSQGAWAIYTIGRYKSWWPWDTKNSFFIWSISPIILFFLGWYQQPSALANYDFLFTLTVYPIAALVISVLPENTIKQLSLIWLFAVVVGLLYPISWYFFHMEQSNIAYGSGRSLPTFMDSDHIRFGMFLCAGLLFLWLYYPLKNIFIKWCVIVLVLCILFLSVRTAWVMLLVMCLISLLLDFSSANRKLIYNGLLLLLFFIGMSVAAYYIFPTVQQKVAYTIYDWQQFTNVKFQPNFSDGVRRIVNHASLQSVQSGGANVGWAGIPEALQYYFNLNFPHTNLQYGRPFNQWLFWYMGSGWWGMILFTIWFCYPLYWGLKNNTKGLVYWTAAIGVSCLVESNLTFQFGVFLHAWPLAMIWGKGMMEKSKVKS